MAELLITEAVSQAEEAIESGNYGGAIETCQRILGEFPEFARAHRIMAEAYAEQGDAEAAKHAYQRTLERDPQSIAAHLGLGMIAEEAGEMEAALAHFQVAWEIDPRRRDLREQVSRISQQVYGDDGRLYLTRAALASLHFHAGRWDRAVTEAAQVLQELNQRIDVQVRMGEALWRRGDDEQAKQVCTTILRTLPNAVVPLMVLADIHRRRGNASEAAELRAQARAIDPDGVRAADLIIVGLDDQAEFLMVDDVPTIDDQVLAEEPAARYAPAPDFTAEDEDPEPAVAESPAAEVDAAPAPAPETPSADPGDDGIQPFRWEDIGDEDLEVSDLDQVMAEPSPEVEEAESPNGTEDETVSFDLFSDEEIDQARPSDERPAGFTGMLNSLDLEGMQPFDPEGSGFPGDIEGATEVPPESDEAMRSEALQAEPPAEPAQEPAAAAEPETAEPEPEADLFDVDWSQVDNEIQEAIPGETPPGYTDELRDLDSAGVEPFSFEDPSSTDLLREDIFEPSAVEEDSELPEPSAAEQPAEPVDEGAGELDFDELARGWEESPSAEAESEPAADVSGDLESIDELFGEFGQAPAEEPVAEPEPEELPAAEFAFDHQDSEPDETRNLGDVFDELFHVEPQTEDEEIGAGSTAESSEPEAWTEELQAVDHWPQEVADEPVLEHVEPEPEPAAEEIYTGIVEETTSLEIETTVEDFAPAEALSTRAPQATDIDSVRQAAQRLGLDAELVERARQSKVSLVREGRIDGRQRLPGAAITLDDLRGAVESAPDDTDNRIALAAALIETSPNEALEQFRWIYRNAPDRGPEIVADLVRLIEVTREREVGAHRLLGAVYRRHGDWLAAANHYEESLTAALRHLR